MSFEEEDEEEDDEVRTCSLNILLFPMTENCYKTLG